MTITSDQLRNTARFGTPVRTETLTQAADQQDALLDALAEITPGLPPKDAPCHLGIVEQSKCGHCSRIMRARGLLRAHGREA